MKQVKKTTMLFALMLGLFTQVADAALINNGDFTTDDVSGLQWLDLSFTDGMTYNQALSTYGEQGWVGVTQTDYLAMYDRYFPQPLAAGVEFLSVNDSATINYANMIADMFGITGTGTTVKYSYGMVLGDDGSMNFGGLQVYTDLTSANLHRFRTASLVPDADTAFANFGVFLVRQAPVAAVAEPASFLLFSLGLAGLLVARRKA